MKCPVCKTDGIQTSDKSCSHCHSDLEAFQITGSLKKSFRKRLYFGVTASVLFIAILLMWIVFDASAKNNEPTAVQKQSDTEASWQEKLQLMELKTAKLNDENTSLKERLAKLQEKSVKRQKNYEVQYGESLFTIARKVYGNGYRYQDLAKDNNITDPEQIKVGQVLVIYY